MIRKPTNERKYASAHDRLLKPAIVNFFETEFSGMFGPVVRKNIADELISLFESLCPEQQRLKPGQLVWNALDKTTRADSPNRKYKPVTLTIVADEDITLFEKATSVPVIRKGVIQRLIKEAYEQGAVLSTRDLSLLLVSDGSYISNLRIKFEEENQVVLPHAGVLHDMGTTLTHKRIIVYKHVVEKKDPMVVAKETNHSQRAVDRYLKDYNRVKALVKDKKDIDFIHLATGMSLSVIKQYQKIIDDYVKDL